MGAALSRGAVQAAIDGIDARNWAARGDRVGVLRRAMQGGDATVRRALSATAAFDAGPFDMPGPTGETNRLSLHPKGVVLCLGATVEIALAQAVQALVAGCGVVIAVPGSARAVAPLAAAGAPVAALDGTIPAEMLQQLRGVAAVGAVGPTAWTGPLRRALAARDGAILPLETEAVAPGRYYVERHLCVDTTAAGGNASLLASTEEA